MNNLIATVTFTEFLLDLLRAGVGLAFWWAALRVMDRSTGATAKGLLNRMREDPNALAAYLGRRNIAVALFAGLLLAL